MRPSGDDRQFIGGAALRTECRRPCRCCDRRGRHRPPRRGAGRTAGAEITAGIIGGEAAATAAAAAVEHRQGRVEALQHDFGRVLLDAALVGPFAGLQHALDVNLGAFLQILLDNLAGRVRRRSRRGATRSFPCVRRCPCRARSPTSRCSDWQSAARPVSAGFQDPCRGCRPKSPCSRFPPSPLSTQNNRLKSPVRPALAGRLQFLTCRLIRLSRPLPDIREATLYARRPRRLSAP